jgi:hypothetical protein
VIEGKTAISTVLVTPPRANVNVTVVFSFTGEVWIVKRTGSSLLTFTVLGMVADPSELVPLRVRSELRGRVI